MAEHDAGTPQDAAARKRALLRQLLAKKQKGGARDRGPDSAIPRQPAGQPMPLTFAQEALWFVDQLDDDEALHNVPGAVRLEGRLDVAALEAALDGILQRHEILRATVDLHDGQPMQTVQPHQAFRLPQEDLSDRADAREEADRRATAWAHQGFDLTRGPLFRALLLRVGPEHHVLLINFHHIVTDGWSMRVFTRELCEGYAARLEGRAPDLPELTAQFADFAAWQRGPAMEAEMEEHARYWREHLAGRLTPTELPTDHPRPDTPSFQGGHQGVQLSAELSDALRQLARTQGATPYAVLTAAFKVLLHHASGQQDVVIGSAIAHRNRRELEGLIGFLVNMLVLRTDLAGDPDFLEILRRVKETILGAFIHQDMPLTRIVREVQPDRDLGRTPLFTVEFSLLTPDHNPAVYGYGLDTGIAEPVDLPGLSVRPVPVHYDNARYDVAFFLWDMPQGIVGTVEYRRDLFDAPTMRHLVEDYEALLRRLVQAPDQRLSALTGFLEQRRQEREGAAQEGYQQLLKKKLGGLRGRPRRGRSGPSPGDPTD